MCSRWSVVLAMCARCWPVYMHGTLASCHSENTCTHLIMWAIVKLTTTRHRVCSVMRASEAMFWIVYHMWINGHVCWLHLKLNTSYDTSHTNFKCRRLGVTPFVKSYRFVRVCAWYGCQVKFELKTYQWLFHFPFCDADFCIFPCVAWRFPVSPCDIEVKSKDNRSEFEVKSKWNWGEPTRNRSDIELKSKWNRHDTEVISKWNRCEIEVHPKWNRSEVELKSKWTQRAIEVNPKWNWSDVEVSSK